MKVVLYHGQRIEVPSVDELKNVARCYNPTCDRYVQTRPDVGSLAGRPKRFCTEKCRWKWKQKRSRERRQRTKALMITDEEIH